MEESMDFSQLSWLEKVNLAIEWRRNNVSYRMIADQLRLAAKTVRR